MLPLCRQKRKPDYNKLIPLVYAPALPLCRLMSIEGAYARTLDIVCRFLCSHLQTNSKMFQTQ